MADNESSGKAPRRGRPKRPQGAERKGEEETAVAAAEPVTSAPAAAAEPAGAGSVVNTASKGTRLLRYW